MQKLCTDLGMGGWHAETPININTGAKHRLSCARTEGRRLSYAPSHAPKCGNTRRYQLVGLRLQPAGDEVRIGHSGRAVVWFITAAILSIKQQ